MSLHKYRVGSLRDKLISEAEDKRDKLEAKDEKQAKIIKKAAKKK